MPPQKIDLSAGVVEDAPDLSAGVVESAAPAPSSHVPPSFWSNPKEFLQQRIKSLQGTAQGEMNKAFGPESQGASFTSRLGHRTLSLAPETAAVADKIALGLLDWRTAAGMVLSKIDPALTAAYFGSMGIQQAREAAHDPQWYKNPEKVQNFLLGLSQTAAAGAGGKVEGAGKAVTAIKRVPETVQRIGQRVTGAGPETTTKPMIEKFRSEVDEATAKRAVETANVEEQNRAITEKGFNKAGELRTKYNEKLQEHTRSLEQQKAEHQAEVRETIQKNQETARIESRREALARGGAEGSKELGRRVQDLDEKLRAEDNENYEPIHKATAKDPGVSAADLGAEARAIEGKFIKGSKESIKQFRELIQKDPEEGIGAEVPKVITKSNPLYDAMTGEAPADITEHIAFDDLQGYSSELGRTLSKGGLPGDVFQAVKALKETIDAHKTAIAERNGVAPQLEKADAFHRSYMEVFYDKPSAVAGVRGRIGKLDPEFYAEPFTKGKSGDVAIGKLRTLPTQHIDEARSIADLATNLRGAVAESESLPKAGKVKPYSAAPTPEAPPERPKLPEVEYKTPKQIPQPEAPTVEQLREAKAKKVRGKSAELSGLRRYDLMVLAGSSLAPFISRWETALIGPAAVGMEKALAAGLDRPAVVRWLAEPRPEEIAAINRLPEEAQNGIRQDLQGLIRQETSQGRPPKLSPEVSRFLLSAPKGQKKPANRREAMEMLGVSQ